MLLVVYTQVYENYGTRWKPKWGHEYVVARLTVQEVVDLGKTGMAAIVAERRLHVEHDRLPEEITCTGDYDEQIVDWEIVEDDYVTHDQKSYDENPEYRHPCEERPALEDRSTATDAERIATYERHCREIPRLLAQRPGEDCESYHARALARVQDFRVNEEED